MKFAFWILSSSLLVACATQNPVISTVAVEPVPTKVYWEVLGRYSRKTTQFTGFHQSFQADVTILNSEVVKSVSQQRAYFYQWDQHQLNTERERQAQINTNSARFFVRLFSPDRTYDDLNKPNTIWRVYLESNGVRYEGKAVKMKEKLIELQTLFPTMDRFSTGYEVTFAVPMTSVEKNTAKFVMTSSLGVAEFIFPGIP